MIDQEILPKVRELLAEVLGLDPASIAPEASLMDDLGAESIDLLDMRFRMERIFGFKITGEDLVKAFPEKITAEEFRRLFTVGALCLYVGKRLHG